MAEAKRPAYLRTHRIAGRKLAFLLGTEAENQLEKGKEGRSDEEEVELAANSLLVLDGGVPHNVVALRDSTLLITISFAP
jgi:hypothetical protein